MKNISGLKVFLGGIKSWRFYAYIFILTLCFVLFEQGDLTHTTISSYAYLNGHITDFYEYNKIIIGGNDYLPLLYVIFAAWNLPLHLMDMTGPEYHAGVLLTPLAMLWSKLLAVIFFFATVKVLDKIYEAHFAEVGKTNTPIASIFATSPIAIFAVFIFSQYDIIGVFFTLLGYYFYLKKDLSRFAWLFSIAISFKYYALIIYFPLLIMVEKRFLHIAKYLLIGIVVTLVQVALYWKSEIFRGEIFSLASGKMSGAYGSGLSIFKPTLYLLAAYLMGCFYLYLKKFDMQFEWKRAAVLVPIAAYGLVLSAVVWHPQWLIIVMPFFALAYIYARNSKIFVALDLIGMLAFIWICVNAWVHNVDGWMILRGALREYIPVPLLENSELMLSSWVPFFRVIFGIYLFSPIILILIESYIKQLGNRKEISDQLLIIRSYVGVSFFVVLAFICTFVPLSWALKINPAAYLNSYKMLEISTVAEVPVGEIFRDKTVEQSFKPTLNGLSVISVKLATYARTNSGKIVISLKDEGGKILAQKVLDAALIKDNEYYEFVFDSIWDSNQKIYSLVIQSDNSIPGNAITAWASKSDVYLDGQLKLGGDQLGGDLVMKLYFAPRPKQVI